MEETIMDRRTFLRTAVMTASGGQAELIPDVASTAGLDLPPLSAGARAEVERVVGTLTGDGNPLDAWGNGDFATNFPHALHVLGGDPGSDARRPVQRQLR
jgi:hypothetical protein